MCGKLVCYIIVIRLNYCFIEINLDYILLMYLVMEFVGRKKYKI